MQRRLFLFSWLGLLATPAGQVLAEPVQQSRLVFHVNDASPDHQEAVLRNLHNHLSSVGPDHLDIKVLLQGQGVTLLLLPEALEHVAGLSQANAGPNFRPRIDALRAQGVEFLVSSRSLVRHRIDYRRDLYDVQPRDVVPNAFSYLAELQQHGYTYIKP